MSKYSSFDGFGLAVDVDAERFERMQAQREVMFDTRYKSMEDGLSILRRLDQVCGVTKQDGAGFMGLE